ncbi:TIGR00282 family metallophosphoesterase [Luteolibacter ambystomatis]|uniref:TIGR00282 family metallophosphoesterase n=1 Tax=Luteolibacter ambystomatis TaxID=2824561 RepID=A0A975G6K4_9BACT|nr:TIGR00282 family metallophosphoesterase [Luteolibacter ambystomatis]QUE49716.1 TIGR00282 family metallophosphoesterase [Luteolibacter ambystomatis]
MSSLRILFLGDVVGEPGRKAVIAQLPRFREEEGVDFIIVNGENAAGGRGITPRITIDLLRAGAAVVTTGDHVWDQPEIVDYFPTEPRLLRPLNYPEGTPGGGSVVLETAKGKVGVVQVQGRSFIQPPLENPFLAAEAEVERLRADGVNIIVCEIHAETTSEKIAMGRLLDGKASFVVGTHTHVQTADERIFPGGTGFLTDAGMCGPEDSVLGRSVESVVWRFRTGLPTRFPVAKGPVRLCGAIVDVDTETGKCISVRRVSHLVEAEAPEPAAATPQTL